MIGSLSACGIHSKDVTNTQKQVNNTMKTEDMKELPIYKYEVKEIRCDNSGQSIYGIAYVPKTEGKVPLVIFSHEFTNTHTSGIAYAENLASHGIATYVFDFRGGSIKNKSDGKTTEMSVMTEVTDLESVIETAKNWDFVNPEKIVLLGGSQGGVVSAITAARHNKELTGLILLYPAFVIEDDIHKMFSSLDEVPDTFSYRGWITVGRKYIEDMWDYDVYGEIGNFDKQVLILHGNEDNLVDISYSKRAAEKYDNAELYVIKGAGHGFGGSNFDEVMTYIWQYLHQVEII